MSKIKTAAEAVRLIGDDAMVAVNSSSGLCCPDAVLKALGERFDAEGHPRNLTSIHPIAAGDMFGSKGVDHIAKPGMLAQNHRRFLSVGPDQCRAALDLADDPGRATGSL